MKQYFHGRSLVGAEIGVLRGANTINILRHLNIKKLYLIDPYLMYDGIDGGQKTTFEKTFKLVKHNLRKYIDKVVFIKKKSSDAANDIPDVIDFIYIDGNHLYKYVKQDIELYYPKIRADGVICGHDFDLPDVAQAVTEFAKGKKLKVSAYGYPVDWWIVKEEKQMR